MRKVTAICVHDNMKQIYNLSVVTSQGITIELVRYKKGDKIKPYCYFDFQDLYKSVLNLLKQNDFYVSKYTAFESDFYNVNFIDMNNPCKIEKYGFKGDRV